MGLVMGLLRILMRGGCLVMGSVLMLRVARRGCRARAGMRVCCSAMGAMGSTVPLPVLLRGLVGVVVCCSVTAAMGVRV